jgi:type III pantothenate kinase
MGRSYAVLLVVDVGNTQTHFGTYRDGELVEHWRFATVRESTADELGAVLRNLLELRGIGLADLDASIVSSTVPQLRPEWEAMDKVHGACVVVDFGTALTFDPVSADGEYLGGIIAPGVEISMEALTNRAAALPKIDLAEPRALIGKTTVDAIRSGVVYGYAGQVDGILRRLRAEMGADIETIATGGLAEHIVPFTEEIDETDDLLTLTGLRLLHERNA